MHCAHVQLVCTFNSYVQSSEATGVPRCRHRSSGLLLPQKKPPPFSQSRITAVIRLYAVRKGSWVLKLPMVLTPSLPQSGGNYTSKLNQLSIFPIDSILSFTHLLSSLQKSHPERYSTSLVIREMQTKPQDTTSHPLRRLCFLLVYFYFLLHICL